MPPLPKPKTALPAVLTALLAACGTPEPAAVPTAIGAVQGDAARSPLEGREVLVEGVVTADFSRQLGGWFLQDGGDGDPATSDGLFVSAENAFAVRGGDRVRVRGRVFELGEGEGTLTALRPLALEPLGRAETAAAVLEAVPEDWERYEGMRVRVSAPLTVSGHRDLARRGVLLTAFGGRLPAPTEAAPPGAAAAAVAADNLHRTLLLDDGRGDEDPPGVWYLPGDAQAPRAGSTVEGAEGIVDARWGRRRLQLTAPLQLRAAPRPEPPRVGGDVRIATLNLENLFNGDGRGGGFPTERGARSPRELAAQLERLAATVAALDPDVLAVAELENDGYAPTSSIAQLAAALGRGGAEWRFADPGQGPGEDAIRVGLLHRADRVRALGAPATLAGGPFGELSRSPLAQAYVPVAEGSDAGAAFVVVANHFKSKGCGEARGAERDQGDGQGCWNAARTDSARRLGRWLEQDPTGSGSDLLAILGDLNAYTQEDPIRTLLRAGWQDALGDAGEAYTYVHEGQAGRLDHALLSPALAARLAGAAIWHVNADEPQNVGYRAGNGAERQGPWRSSDHDPVLLGLRLRTP
ncbi:ExeM/NucH family extracellular endonuclease [Luteimonas sp. RD2P54]|uniref:ExeM/NucH family extracellular endonuclease n=1 Tax=Luteimonas endophytica TaxID=3042023 RepID=A0ABT6J6S8_9GAMM|nr:ExeM/NucH family extracellular endonuclease [Luteimonas endophytica]MDH5822540.1 ExeM/NucH family extracellular endonuclease [Luteimonas endophytica]